MQRPRRDAPGGGKPRAESGRSWNHAAVNQGTPNMASNRQKPGNSKEGSSLEPSQGAQPCFHLPSSQSQREYISVVFNHPVWGTLLRQPPKSRTVPILTLGSCSLMQLCSWSWFSNSFLQQVLIKYLLRARHWRGDEDPGGAGQWAAHPFAVFSGRSLPGDGSVGCLAA